MSTIDIKSISQIENYLSTSDKIGQGISSSMADLKSAVDRAASVWHDPGISRAQNDVTESMSKLSAAYNELMPILDALKRQVDWARRFSSIS